MSQRLRAILDLLVDPAHDRDLLRQLRDQPDLLRQLYAFARRNGGLPRPLEALALERYSPELLESFSLLDDLESGLWLLPRIENLLADYDTPGRACLDGLAARLAGVADACQLARVLQEDYGYTCDPDGHDSPANAFLPAVLATRCGLPVVITALWSLLAQRLGFEAAILVFPGHIFGRTGPHFLELASRRYDLTLSDLRETSVGAGHDHFRGHLEPVAPYRLLQKLCLNLAITYRHRSALLRCNLVILLGQSLGR